MSGSARIWRSEVRQREMREFCRTRGSRPAGSRLRAAPRRRLELGGIRALAAGSHRSSRCPRWSPPWSSRAARMQARDARFRADRRSDADRGSGGLAGGGPGRAARCDRGLPGLTALAPGAGPAPDRPAPLTQRPWRKRAARDRSLAPLDGSARRSSQPCAPLRSIRGWRAWCGSRPRAAGAAASTSAPRLVVDHDRSGRAAPR